MKPRFSLRTLIILVTLVALYFGLWEVTKRFGVKTSPAAIAVESSPAPLIIRTTETGPDYYFEAIDLWLLWFRVRIHTKPLEWNGQPLPLILDHVDGVNSDNRPEQLQFLCPNCDSQLRTRGGANKGKVKKFPGGFARKDGDNWRHIMPGETGMYGDPNAEQEE